MKIILLGDLHIGIKNNSDIMMKHQTELFKMMFAYAKRNGINTIIQLGDTFDSRRNINLKALQFAYDHLFDVAEANNIDWHTIVGNHDIFYRESIDISSTNLLLKNYKHVHVYDQCNTIKLGKIRFDLIPWICNENYDSCIDYIKNSTSDYCVGHFAINAFPILGNTLYEDGMDRVTFSHYKHVFSGHFHVRSSQNNISYIGTPYQLTWTDANTDNGFVVFDTETETWEYVENPHRYYHYINYDDREGHQSTDINNITLANAFVKVIVKSKEKPFLYNTFINNVFKSKPADVKIVDQALIDIQQQSTDQSIEVKDTINLITDYVDSVECGNNKEKLKRFLIKLYNEANQLQDDGLC